MKFQTITTNFTAGEFSPSLQGRVDIEKYNSSAKLLRNVEVMKQGGFTIRPPLDFCGAAKLSLGESDRLIPFIFSRTDAFILEFGYQHMRVWRSNGTQVESSPGVPYEIALPWPALNPSSIEFAQSADTMILTSAFFFPKRLRRFSDTRWVIDDAPLNPQPIGDIGFYGAATITLSAATVGAGRTATASVATFLASDVGRVFSSEGGKGIITAVASATSATIDITVAFATVALFSPLWVLEGSPLTTNTPSAKDPVGASITMTLALAGWRTTDVGSLVEINGGLVEITSLDGVNPTTIANGKIRRELTSTVAAQADAWSILSPLWSSTRGFPEVVGFHQQRLWFGNTTTFPQSVWGSRSGLYFDFEPGTLDDSAVYKTIASEQVNPLQHLVNGDVLLMFGYGAEVFMTGGIERPITQTNSQIKVPSEWGAEKVKPAKVGSEVLYVERGGAALRVLFPKDVEGYDTSDVSIYSEHLLAAGVKSISYERRPNSVLWVAMNDGSFAALTYNREQNTIAWSSCTLTDGTIGNFATVPVGNKDVTFALVYRQVSGVNVAHVEKFNRDAGRGKFDSRLEKTGAASATWSGFGHLEGKTVNVVADDVFMASFTIAGGAFTLPRTAVKVSVGLPYTAKALLQSPEVGTGTGTAQGQAQSTNHVWVKLLNTVGLKINGKTIEFRKFGAAVLDNPVPSFSGLKEVSEYGWETGASDLELVQDQGMPWTVLYVVRNFTVNQG